MPLPSLLPLAPLVAVVLGAACAGSTAPLPHGGRRVLFVGNSLTYGNDLPRTVADMARQLGETPLVYRAVAKPDYALEDHWYEGIAGAIRNGGWQVVVMQQGPSSLPANQEHLRLWSTRLDSVARTVGARSALYQVWPSIYYINSFDAVRTSYRAAALAVNGMFIPAGEAWQHTWAGDSGFALYADDGLHASRVGTYVAALVHFEMLYDRPATDLPDTGLVAGRRLDLAPDRVAFLQQRAHETVLAWGIR